MAVQPSFVDILPIGPTYVRSVSIELQYMAFQTVQFVNEIEKVL
jgi:hypothetical protein